MIQKEIIKEGSGECPKKGVQVYVHYTGWLQTPSGDKGTKFDSSVDRGSRFDFTLGAGQVIRGWDETVAKMKKGEKCKVTLPPEAAYGARGAGGVIPPMATLIFEIELFEWRENTGGGSFLWIGVLAAVAILFFFWKSSS